MNLKKRISINKVFTSEMKEVLVAGWIQQVRDLGGLRFIQLQDRTGIIQIVLPKKKVAQEIFSLDLQEGDIIAVSGDIVKKERVIFVVKYLFYFWLFTLPITLK